MNILIDGQTLLTPEINRGIGVYFKNTVENILVNDVVNDFLIVTTSSDALNILSPWARQRIHSVPHDANAHDERAYSECINETIVREKIDLYWSPNPLMLNVFLPSKTSAKCCFAATIFDLIPAVMESHFTAHWPGRMMGLYKARLHALETDYDLFLHISAQTKSDFLRLLRVSDKQHLVTPLAADGAFRPFPFPTIPEEARRYVLYPGGFDPRKNMDRALEAFAIMKNKYSREPGIDETDLVIVCHKNSAAEAAMYKRARQLGIADNLKLPGFVSDPELIDLYQKARALFFPSLYEGFGLPVLEGLACGLPVACSNTSSMPEIAGDLACYFDPLNVESMAEALHEVVNAPVDLELRRRRHEYARQFSWQRTALETLRGLSGINGGPDCDEQTTTVAGVPTIGEERPSEIIDVRRLIAEMSVEELCRTADEFFARLDNVDYLHAKPLAAINETPELLVCFAQVLQGLKLLPDMTILDFGAGSCWTSRFLSQLGLRVIAQDVSSSALRIGEELYRRWPVAGDQPPPRFLHFNGYDIELPDETVDRISCWDAFHHVPNQERVLREMARVLKQGGIAGFSEPGPEHSTSPQSQYEMRTNRVIENDIHVGEIWAIAKAAGFTDIKLSLFNPFPFLVSLEEFEAYVDNQDPVGEYGRQMIEQMQHRRIFFLFKGEYVEPADSRKREGLMCELDVKINSTRIAASEALSLEITVRNTGANVWLPTTARVGAVHFGIHLFDKDGGLLDLDYFRAKLTAGTGREILPGESVQFDAEVPLPGVGKYILQFDLVSEAVCWFEHNGAALLRQPIEVVQSRLS